MNSVAFHGKLDTQGKSAKSNYHAISERESLSIFSWPTKTIANLRRASILDDEVNADHYSCCGSFNVKASPTAATTLRSRVAHNLELTAYQLCGEVDRTSS